MAEDLSDKVLPELLIKHGRLPKDFTVQGSLKVSVVISWNLWSFGSDR